MEDSKKVIDYFLNFLDSRKYELLNSQTMCSRSYNYLSNFIKSFLRDVLDAENEEDVKKSIFYNYIKNGDSIIEFYPLKLKSRYVNQENFDFLDEKILIDCVISNIFLDFEEKVENYIDTIFCLRAILDKYSFLDKTIEIMDSLQEDLE